MREVPVSHFPLCAPPSPARAPFGLCIPEKPSQKLGGSEAKRGWGVGGVTEVDIEVDEGTKRTVLQN